MGGVQPDCLLPAPDVLPSDVAGDLGIDFHTDCIAVHAEPEDDGDNHFDRRRLAFP
jgi:hypothetical protein